MKSSRPIPSAHVCCLLHVAALTLFCVASISGCRSAPSSADAALRPRSLASTAISVRGSPAYREAEASFARKDFLGALAAIKRLLESSSLSSSDRVYLNRQRDICLVALGERGKAQDARSKAPRATSVTPPTGDCGPRALVIAAKSLGIQVDAAAIVKQAGTTRSGTSLQGLKKAAESLGLKAEGIQVDGPALRNLDPPAIAWVNGEHYLALLKVVGDRATIHDPNEKNEETIETDELLRRSGGILLTLRRSERK
jgi:hypothetical protein